MWVILRSSLAEISRDESPGTRCSVNGTSELEGG